MHAIAIFGIIGGIAILTGGVLVLAAIGTGTAIEIGCAIGVTGVALKMKTG